MRETMMKTYKSELLMVCHMDAKAMHEVGAISDKEMLKYDRECLVAETKPSYGSSSTQPQSVPVFAAPGKK